MGELKTVFESLGFDQVQTYIQSGNVIFKTAVNDASEIKELIITQIEKKYGFTVDVVLRTLEELEISTKKRINLIG